MKKHSEKIPDWHDQRKRIIGLGESSIRKSYYPELQQRIAELEKKNEDLNATYEDLSYKEEELRQNYEELSVTERKLRESERKFRAIFDQTFQFIGLMTPEGTILEANRTSLKFGGQQESDIFGKPIWETPLWIHSEELQKKLRVAVQDAAKGEFVRFEVTHVAADGTLHYIDFSIKPVRDDAGRVILLIPEGRDITDRKRAEEAIQKSGREWQTTFNAITDAVFLLDDKGRIIRHNRALELFTGKTSDEIDGRYCYEVMHGTTSPIKGCPNVKAEKSRQRESIELKIGNRWVIAAVDPIFSENGTFSGAVHLLIDITERKQAEEALNQARKKLSFLNAITFSDIQNSIFTLSGYLELEKTLPTDEKLPQFKENERKIVQTIAESLKFTGIYQSLGLKPPLWQNVQQSFLMAISHLDISTLARRLEVGSVEIYADPLLENVFFALTENVVRHARTATELTVRYHESPDGLTLFFEDNGTGVPVDLKEKIFEQGYGRRKGLGLFISREILSVTGITIKETGEPGKGARFEIMVPKSGYRFGGNGPEGRSSVF
jgi:PAS domain S-box-containing protein